MQLPDEVSGSADIPPTTPETGGSTGSSQHGGEGSGASAPAFMDRAGTEEHTAETPAADNMHVDFMERGERSRPAPEKIPEKPIETRSSFTYRMPDAASPERFSGGTERKIHKDPANAISSVPIRDPSRIMDEGPVDKDN